MNPENDASRLHARCRITLSETLKIDVGVVNSGTKNFKLTCAFHPYFGVADVRNVEIPVVGKMGYEDFLAPRDAAERKGRAEPLVLSKEIDRAYAYDGAAVLDDHAGKRRIMVSLLDGIIRGMESMGKKVRRYRRSQRGRFPEIPLRGARHHPAIEEGTEARRQFRSGDDNRSHASDGRRKALIRSFTRRVPRRCPLS